MITNEMKAKRVVKRIKSLNPKQKAKDLNFYLKKWASPQQSCISNNQPRNANYEDNDT